MNVFGLASTVFRGQALGPGDLDLAAANGFTQIEVVSAPGHFDVTSEAAVTQLRAAAAAAGVSVLSLTVEPAATQATIEAAVALSCPLIIVRTRPCSGARLAAATHADAGVLRKLIDDVAPQIPSGVKVAIDFPAWPGFTADDLMEFLESGDAAAAGVCLDAGHAALGGSAVDAAETLSGYLQVVRLHDNHGREDNHRVPGSGAIDWPAVMTSCWKAGFTGPWILAPIAAADGSPNGTTEDTVRRAVGARTRLQAILEDLAQPFTFTE